MDVRLHNIFFRNYFFICFEKFIFRIFMTFFFFYFLRKKKIIRDYLYIKIKNKNKKNGYIIL